MNKIEVIVAVKSSSRLAFAGLERALCFAVNFAVNFAAVNWRNGRQWLVRRVA